MQNKRAHNFKDLTGKIFNRLTVLKFDKIKNRQTYWLCQCKCGIVKSIRGSHLVIGRIQSCGCLVKEMLNNFHKQNIKHGMAKTRFYGVWHNMKGRCLNPNDGNYIKYGAEGITVCDRWLKFENFRDDMYISYLEHVEEFGLSNTSIDRINSKGNYELSNCRWATTEQQNRNRKISSLTTDYKLHCFWNKRLRSNLSKALSGNWKISRFLELYLGCSIWQFKKYIESQFTDGMNWDNYGRGKDKWQIDHIIGCNNFDLSKEEDRKKCFNYRNLRPMWYEDHMKKSIKRLPERQKL